MGASAEADIAVVTALDQAWNRAYEQGDRSPLSDVLSDDFVATTEAGQEVGKAQLLQDPPEAALEVRVDEFSIRCWGDTAITRGRIQVRTPSRFSDQHFMRVYARRAGSWQAVSLQVVPVVARNEPVPRQSRRSEES
ncbi:MAG: nuclear transport factor 2 family protein [Myxococcales bacterium]|nr:nuclear transport factor 2 family protein [Myxococcales bacterium]